MKSIDEKINDLNIPDLYVIYYTDLDNDLYNEYPHGSEDRTCSSFNLVEISDFNGMKKSLKDKKNKDNVISPFKFKWADKYIGNYPEFFTITGFLRNVCDNNIINYLQDQKSHKGYDFSINSLPEFLKNLNDNMFDIIMEKCSSPFETIFHNYNIPTIEYKKLVLYNFIELNMAIKSNMMFGSKNLNPNSKDAELFISKINKTQFIDLCLLITVDFSKDVLREPDDYPIFDKWKEIDYKLYKDLEKTKEPLNEFVKRNNI